MEGTFLVAGVIGQDLRDFDLKVRRILGSLSPTYAVEPEIAGIPVEMTYDQGSLSAVVTLEGEEVKDHVKTILSVPLTLACNNGESLPIPDLITVSAVVYIEKQALSSLNQERKIQGLPVFLGGRECVMDSLAQSNARAVAKRPLDLFCHSARLTPRIQVHSHYDLMLRLQQWGLRINRPHIRVCRTVADALEYSDHLRVHQETFPYELDGTIISVNELSYQEMIATETGTPDWRMAHRF